MTNESFEYVVGDLDFMVRELASKREGVKAAERCVNSIQNEIDALFGGRLKAARARLALAQAQAGELDAQTRLDGLEKWEQDPTHKRPHPAIGIRVNKVVKMDQDAALIYAIERGKWIKLDLRAFKKDAKLELGKSEPDEELMGFSEMVEQPTATIARDLGEYLDDDAGFNTE